MTQTNESLNRQITDVDMSFRVNLLGSAATDITPATPLDRTISIVITNSPVILENGSILVPVHDSDTNVIELAQSDNV
jgi:hypothetical protein